MSARTGTFSCWGASTAFALSMLFWCYPAAAGELLPPPQEVTLLGSPISLSEKVELASVSQTSETAFLIQFLTDALEDAGVTVGSDPEALRVDLHLFGDPPPPGGLPQGVEPFAAIGDQGYVLAVPEEGGGLRVVVAAEAAHGLFNGGMTLLQLLLEEEEEYVFHRETELAPQLIRDYPDHEIRAGYLYSVRLAYQDGQYVSTDDVRQRIDQLARIKFNTLFLSGSPDFFRNQNYWDKAHDGLAALQQYCAARFIEFVPSLGTAAGTPSAEFADGSFVYREPFHFEERPQGLIQNDSFEVDNDVDGVPDAWSISAIDPEYGTWTLDHSFSHSGGSSMQLWIPDRPDGPSTNSLTIGQRLPVPEPGTYAVEAWMYSQEIEAYNPQVTLYGRFSDGTNTNTASIVFNSADATGEWGYHLSYQHLVISEDDDLEYLTLYARQMEPGYTTLWLDDVRVVRVEEIDGEWQVVEPELRFEAVADTPPVNLLVNGGLEEDIDADGVPDGWKVTNNATPGATWTADYEVKHSGQKSMRLDVEPGANGTSVCLSQTLPLDPPVPPGHYLLTAWVKTQGVTGRTPQITFYTQRSSVTEVIQSIGPSTPSVDWKHYQAALRIQDELDPETDSFKVYSRLIGGGSGTVWVDDLSIQRLDGDLREVLRDSYDIQVRPQGVGTPYLEGVDYEVVDGDVNWTYSSGSWPTRILLLDGGAIDPSWSVRINFDKNLFYGGNSKHGLNLCVDRTIDDLYEPAFYRALVELPTLSGIPVRGLNLNSDEFRGFNRSGACHDENAEPLMSNGELLATFFNALVDSAKAIQGDVDLYAWDDGFSPDHNGGGPRNQVNYGGYEGLMSCAVEPSFCGPDATWDELSTDVQLMTWLSSQAWIYQQNHKAQFFGENGHQTLSAPWYDLENVRDWAAITSGTPSARGLIALPWGTDGRAYNEDGLPLTTSLGWNAEWAQVLYAPFEDTQAELEAAGFVFSNADHTKDKECARTDGVMKNIAPEFDINGGVCAHTDGSVSLPAIAIDNSSSYLVGVDGSSDADTDARVRFHWEDLEGALHTTESSSFTIAGDGEPDEKVFNRYSVTTTPPAGGVPLASLQAEIVVAGEAKLDNAMIWRSRNACPDGRLLMEGLPEVLDLGEVPIGQAVDFSLDVVNGGCEDLILTEISVVPEGAVDFPSTSLPLVLRANQAATLQGRLVPLPSNVEAFVALVGFSGDDPDFPTQYVSVQATTATEALPILGPAGFETDFGAWSNVGGDDLDWTRDSGGTPSSGTGPSVDHTTGTSSGSYLYTESSWGGNPGKTAILESPCIDLAGKSSSQWSFWYHMLGSAMGTLNAEVAPGCGSTWETLFSVSGNQGDIWLEADVDLSAYLGQSIKLRLRGVTGSSYTSDMAIDDVLVTAAQLPECIVHSECDDAVACTDDLCDVGTCLFVDNCPSGEICNESAGICVECLEDIDCDDGNPCTDDLCDAGFCQNLADPDLCVTSYPATEDFEAGFGGWSNAAGDDLDWTRDSGGTPSSGTGPSVDHTTGTSSGFYLYTESSTRNTGYPNKTALLEGPCFDLSDASSATWTFWYHMLGNSMGQLNAEVAPDCGADWTTLFTVSGDQGNTWIQGVLDLSPFGGTRVGVRFRGVTGSRYTSDMAIDDISVDATP